MRVVFFWAMCHHSLGHEKKALLSDSLSFRQIVGMNPFFQSANLTFHVD